MTQTLSERLATKPFHPTANPEPGRRRRAGSAWHVDLRRTQ